MSPSRSPSFAAEPLEPRTLLTTVVFYSTRGNPAANLPSALKRASIDGGSVQTLPITPNAGVFTGVAADPADGKIFFADGAGLYNANLNGSGVTHLVTGTPVTDLELDLSQNFIFFSTGTEIRRCNLDGSGQIDIATGLADTTGVALDVQHAKVYFTNNTPTSDTIEVMDYTGANRQTFVRLVDNSEPFDVEYDPVTTLVYFDEVPTTPSVHRIDTFRADQTGPVITVVSDGIGHGLRLDPARRELFYTDEADGNFNHLNVDTPGASPQTFLIEDALVNYMDTYDDGSTTDLFPISITTDATTLVPNTSHTFTVTLDNNGPSAATSVDFAVTLTTDTTLGNADDFPLFSKTTLINAPVGQPTTDTTTGIGVPNRPGTYHLAVSLVNNTGGTPINDSFISPTTITITAAAGGTGTPDLVAAGFANAPATLTPGALTTLGILASNIGTADAPAFQTNLFLFPDGHPESTVLLASFQTNSLPAGTAQLTLPVPSFNIPANLPPGDYRFSVLLNSTDAFGELDDSNNLLVSAFTVPLAAANLLQNGSFESGDYSFDPNGADELPAGSTVIANWTTLTDAVAVLNDENDFHVTPQDGGIFLDLADLGDGFGGVTQTVPTTPGAEYALTFFLGAHPVLLGGNPTVLVSAGDNSDTFTTPPTDANTNWVPHTLLFTATATATTITFQAQAASNVNFIGLDNVSLTQTSSTPPPPTNPTIPVTGALDPTFGNGTGKVTSTLAGPPFTTVTSLTQADGKTLNIGSDSAGNFVVARLNADGSPDPTFGTDAFGAPGVRRIPAGANAVATTALLQADGKILAGGYANSAGNPDPDFALVRLNPDGSLDTSFGTAGVATYDLGSLRGAARSTDALRAITPLPDGRFYLGGTTTAAGSSNTDAVVLRISQNGAPDTSFGPNGLVTLDFLNNSANDTLAALTLQKDGKLLVAGSSATSSSTRAVAVRLLPNGQRDPKFATKGTFTLATSSPNAAFLAAAVTPDQKSIFLAGYTANTNTPGANFTSAGLLVDLTSAGKPDKKFNRGRPVTASAPNSPITTFHTLLIIPQLNLPLISASTANSFADLTTGNLGAALFRFTATGAPDKTLNNTGSLVLVTAPTSPPAPLVPSADPALSEAFNNLITLRQGTITMTPGGGIRSLAALPHDANSTDLTIVAVTRDAIDLAALALTAPKSPATPGKSTTATLKLANQGSLVANGKVPVQLFLSTDSTLSDDDTLIGTVTVSLKKLNPKTTAKPLKLKLTLPKNTPTGPFFLLARINPNNAPLAELTPLNNTAPTPTTFTVGTTKKTRTLPALFSNDPVPSNI